MNKSNRRKFIGTAAALMVGTATASAMPVLDKKYPIIHHVFFWLKNPESKEDKAKLIEGIKALKKIETVGALHVGTVADTEKRDVIDQSWSVSELIFFADLKGQATYQTHPLHVEFVKKYSKLWSKVVVYDIVDA